MKLSMYYLIKRGLKICRVKKSSGKIEVRYVTDSSCGDLIFGRGGLSNTVAEFCRNYSSSKKTQKTYEGKIVTCNSTHIVKRIYVMRDGQIVFEISTIAPHKLKIYYPFTRLKKITPWETVEITVPEFYPEEPEPATTSPPAD